MKKYINIFIDETGMTWRTQKGMKKLPMRGTRSKDD